MKTTTVVAIPMAGLGVLIGSGIGALDRDEEIHELATMRIAQKSSVLESVIWQLSLDRLIDGEPLHIEHALPFRIESKSHWLASPIAPSPIALYRRST